MKDRTAFEAAEPDGRLAAVGTVVAYTGRISGSGGRFRCQLQS
jgi:hypothetical protein